MSEADFLRALEKKLWTSANKLLPSLDAAVYKHVVLGLSADKQAEVLSDEWTREEASKPTIYKLDAKSDELPIAAEPKMEYGHPNGE